METIVNQIELLDRYIRTNADNQDAVLSSTINKLYLRELRKLNSQIADLQEQLHSYELHYKLKTKEFLSKYESGELGDSIDFMEWSATFEMYIKVMEKLKILRNE